MAAPIEDPFISYSPLVIPFDGANNGAVFSDGKGHTLTASGTAVTSTTQSKWGGASGYFDGSGYVSSPNSADFDCNNVDFAIEFWVWLPTGSAGGQVIRYGKTTNYINYAVKITSTGVINVAYGHTTSWQSADLSTPAGIPRDQWVFVKASRVGTAVQCWVNGASYYSALTATINTATIPAATIIIGNNHESNLPLNAYIDDLRVTIGNARTATDTVVPTSAFALHQLMISGALTVSETGADVAAVIGHGVGNSVMAIETGADTCVMSGFVALVRDLNNWNVPDYTGNSIIDSLLSDFVILSNILPARKTLYFSFDYVDWTGFSSSATAYSRVQCTTAQNDAVIAIFSYIQSITGIKFVQVSTAAAADIVFARTDLSDTLMSGVPAGWYTTGQTFSAVSWNYNSTTLKFTAFAYKFAILIDTYHPTGALIQADIDNPVSGNYGYGLLLHEIGHALGLKHPFENPRQYSSFSTCYFSDSVMNYTGNYVGASAYHPYDLMALEWLYKGSGIGYIPPLPSDGSLAAYESLTSASITTYYLRGWDTTANNFVYWHSVGTPNITPSSTTPTLTGTLTNVCVIGTTQT